MIFREGTAKVRTKRESLFGHSGFGAGQFRRANGLEVVNDSVNTDFQEIPAEVDQESYTKPGKPEVSQTLLEMHGFQLPDRF